MKVKFQIMIKENFTHKTINYNLQGFLIDEEEFEVTPITRKLLVFETDLKTKKRDPGPTKENPLSIFNETFTIDAWSNYFINTF